MAIFVSDTPPAAREDHLSTQRDTLQECGAHSDSDSTYMLVKVPPASFDTEAGGCVCWEGAEGGWRTGQITQHAHRQKVRERERERNRQAVSIPSSPASAPTISPARTRRCSWALRGTSWCLPFYPGAPTRSCGKAGMKEGRVWGYGREPILIE